MSRVADPLLSLRGEFPILSSTTYLISNSLGAMPRGAQGALAEYAQAWAARGVRGFSSGLPRSPLFGVIDEIRAGSAGRRWKSRPSLVT